MIGLLGITVFTLGHFPFDGWVYAVISGAGLVLALFTKVEPDFHSQPQARLLEGIALPLLID